ncbi:4-phosphopantetheinyl transferase [Bacillus clarus]|uniref:4-phosphopantetheinyl transferase n=1 Tax=Bacillus clarus TaxID=2338372 RepID=A0A090YC05_9BACI|nr:4'-phosphopantetheinyl transferase superfamily protein [Bacillus clarus]KFM95696.1 phosphopantetheine--transferase domain protein [Bacillus clarus]RFT62608.1 4-phosphopantetheinyl transferase [Bacillus clarus]
MLDVYAVKLDTNISKKKFDILLASVSNEKRERINRFYRLEDAQRTLLGDILVRYIICKKLNIENYEIDFRVNKYGKPYIVNFDHIHFNISHSGDWVVGCCGTSSVGIDIERVEAVDISIAEQFFSLKEYNALKSQNPLKKESFFYELWTLKESYIKAVGHGLSIPLNSFTIKFDKNGITALNPNNSDTYFFKQYDIDEKYKMALCATNHKFPDSVKVINIHQLYEEFILL